MTEGVFKLYVDRSYESQRVSELLKKADVPFDPIYIEGKIGPELLIGDRDDRDNWLTGYTEIKAWLKLKKRNKKGQE